eukprot:UN08613
MSLMDKWVWTELTHWRISDISFDSSIDWCEPNWTITPYIGEFFNCVTVMPATIQFTLLFINILEFRHIIEGRYYVMLFIFLLSSIFGTAAHGTLMYTVGIIDEFVLLNVAIITIFILITTWKKQKDKIDFKWYFLMISGSCISFLLLEFIPVPGFAITVSGQTIQYIVVANF